jgi:hypothetical protein
VKQRLEVILEARGPDLRVVEQTDGGAVERRRRRQHEVNAVRPA